jgi:hypothetical protein
MRKRAAEETSQQDMEEMKMILAQILDNLKEEMMHKLEETRESMKEFKEIMMNVKS